MKSQKKFSNDDMQDAYCTKCSYRARKYDLLHDYTGQLYRDVQRLEKYVKTLKAQRANLKLKTKKPKGKR